MPVHTHCLVQTNLFKPTTMKKPPKRYLSREQIIKDIDRHQDEIAFNYRFIDAQQGRANEFKEWQRKNPTPDKPTDFWRGQFHERREASNRAHEAIAKARRNTARRERQLEHLKEKLATMDTVAMTFLTDVSIV